LSDRLKFKRGSFPLLPVPPPPLLRRQKTRKQVQVL